MIFPYGILLTLSLCLWTASGVFAQENPETISLQLKWKHSFQFAGYYAALEKGFYAEEGLQVRLKEHIPGAGHYIRKVLDGESQYGVGDTGLLLSYSRGEPVVWLSQIYQHSPLVLMTQRESGIASPYELKGKTLAFNEGEPSSASVVMMLIRTLGSEFDQVRFRPQYQGEETLITGENDAVLGYLTNQPFWFRQHGHDINIINPQSYGIDFYGDNLYTTRREAEDHPERVKKMIRATLKGWHYALDHPDEMIELIHERYNSQNQTMDHLIYQSAMAEQMIQRDLIPLGLVDTGRIKGIYQGMKELGLIESKSLALQELVWSQYNPRITLTPEERQWLNENPHISLSAGQNHAMTIRNGEAGAEGIIADYIRLLADSLGHRIDLVLFSDIEEAHDSAGSAAFYGNAAVTTAADRMDQYILTEPYFRTPFVIFTNKTDPSDIREGADLAGLSVAFPQNHPSLQNYLLNLENVTLVAAENAMDQFRLLSNDEVDAIIGYPIYHPLLHRSLYTNIREAYQTKERIGLCIGVNKDYPQLAGILNKAIQGLPMEACSAIHERWFAYNLEQQETRISLCSEEKALLSRYENLRLCVNPQNLPYESINSKGDFEGIVAEYMTILSSRIGLPFELIPTATMEESLEFLRDGLCDMVASNGGTAYAEGNFISSLPYYTTSYVFTVPQKRPLIRNFDEMKDDIIGASHNSPSVKTLPLLYPEINLLLYDSMAKGLLDVATGKIDSYIGTLPAVSYALNNMALSSVKIGGSVNHNASFSMLIRKEKADLIPILNKAINSISADERTDIQEAWVSVTYEKGTDYRLILQILSFCILLLGFLLHRHFLVKKSHRALKTVEMELRKKNAALNAISMKDPLTGLMNRRAIQPIIENEMNRNNRFGSPVSLLILDLDHFKRVNDNHGHDVGDLVLKRVAEALCRICRSTDSVSRWGGEEFLVLTMGTNGNNAEKLAEKIRKTVETILFHNMFYITVSIGIAEYISGTTFEEWFKQADMALYQAKEGGRNRSILYPDISKYGKGEGKEINSPKIIWGPEYCTRNPKIDRQHRELFRLTNAIIDEVEDSGNTGRIGELLETFLQKTRQHFQEEEKILLAENKPDLDSHLLEHKVFLLEFEQWLIDYQSGIIDNGELLRFISQELVLGHVLHKDLVVF